MKNIYLKTQKTRARLPIYLVLGLLLMAKTGLSQERISLELRNTQLIVIMDEIEAQTPFQFIYNNDEIDDQQKMDIVVKNENLSRTLSKLFTNTTISYQLNKNLIILSNSKELPIQKKTSPIEYYSISGIIKDAETGESLIGATIGVEGTNQGAVTNSYGFYSLTLPKGTYRFHCSFVGYELMEFDLNLIKDEKRNIELIVNSTELDEVVVTSNSWSQLQSTQTGVSNLKNIDIKQLPSLLGEPDVTRAILTLPGVSSVGEGATGFNVRGGNIDQNLILLDEAPLYNSSHLWGFFSAFNADAIKDLKLYKGGIPARFGGRASSVLDIRQKEGNTKKVKGEGGLGLLYSRLLLEGPIKKEKLSFLLSGRRSYFDLLFPFLDEEIQDNKIYFYDLSTKLTWKLNENNQLLASGYFGADRMLIKTKGEIQSDGSKTLDETIDFAWKNATASLRWNHLFSSRLFMNVSGIYSKYDYALQTKNDSGGGPGGTSGDLHWTSAVENVIFKPDITFYKNTTTTLRFGINNTFYIFSPASIKSLDQGHNNVKFNAEKGMEVAPYFEYEGQWQKLSFNAGLRYSWFRNIGANDVAIYSPDFPKTKDTRIDTKSYSKGELIKQYSGIEPRLSLMYNLTDNKALKIGYNRMFQYIHLISNTNAALPFDIWKPSGYYVKPLEVNQISIGYTSDSKDQRYGLTVEGYYKTFKNMVEYINGAELFLNENLETQLLPANGFSYGAEFGIHKLTGRVTGNFNYTYSKSRVKTTSPFPNNINDGKYYPSNYDRPHLLNLTGNIKLNKKWGLGTFFTYQTGRPVTQPTSKMLYAGIPRLTYSDKNSYRITDTHRLDISFTYSRAKPGKRWEGSWNFGVYNVYGNKNAFSNFYTYEKGQVKAFRFSVIGAPIPFITYNFKF